jgi:hypothetical protein
MNCMVHTPDTSDFTEEMEEQHHGGLVDVNAILFPPGGDLLGGDCVYYQQQQEHDLFGGGELDFLVDAETLNRSLPVLDGVLETYPLDQEAWFQLPGPDPQENSANSVSASASTTSAPSESATDPGPDEEEEVADALDLALRKMDSVVSEFQGLTLSLQKKQACAMEALERKQRKAVKLCGQEIDVGMLIRHTMVI